MHRPITWTIASLAASALLLSGAAAHSAVTPEQAEQLKTKLTPLGGERVGNADGTIPAWEGGYTKPLPGYKAGGRRPDPFADEKPLYSITAQNLAQYAGKLSEGQQAMLKKYPSYRIDVYPTHRTAAAPHWVYDNTFANATRAQTADGSGYTVKGAYGGVPFPIPQTGAEAMWNHRLYWDGEATRWAFHTWATTASGSRFMTQDSIVENQFPYYYKDGKAESYSGESAYLRLNTLGPAQKAGEALLLRDNIVNVRDSRLGWQYLIGQRRVRKAPNFAYDTPSFVTSGISNFDEIFLFAGPMDRYEWKLAGKKELLVPYNGNKTYQPTKDTDILAQRFLNPDHVRWELHRVWVVEATLRPGMRHSMPKRVFYLDEDSWLALLEDGWDAKGQLWKTFWYLNVVAPEVPTLARGMFGHYNLLTGDWIANNVMNEKNEQIVHVPRRPESHFTAEALAGEGVR
jgi:hypothetical protein